MRSRRAATSISYQYQASSASNPTPGKEKIKKIVETGKERGDKKEKKRIKKKTPDMPWTGGLCRRDEEQRGSKKISSVV